MSETIFKVTEHTVPASHIREYPGSTSGSQEAVLNLHVKQYTPLDQIHSTSDDAITLIAAHGVGFPKELYEPLWDEMWERSKRANITIRGIWIADVASMGESGVINEDKLSTDSSWMDHPRDLLTMISHFRDEMPRPLVGIGHSFGGTIITNLAYLHPRLFTTVILLDPVIQLNPPSMGFGSDLPGPINYVLWRDDVWPNRKNAAEANKMLFRGWDTRCIDRMVKFGFRDLPTALYPELPEGADPSDPPVTLTTTKHQDILGQIRQNFSARTPDGRVQVSRSTHADMDPLAAFIPLYRPEPRSTFLKLPTLRPSVLWLLGAKTYMRIDEMREGIRTCGEGVGGSGGVALGKVKEITMPGHGHLFPFEDVFRAAEHCVDWLKLEVGNFIDSEGEWDAKRESMNKRDHLVLDEEWFRTVKPPRKTKL